MKNLIKSVSRAKSQVWKHAERQDFSDPACTYFSRRERLEYNTYYTDTLYWLGYKARAARSRPHESYISLHSVSHAFHFVLYGTSSWFTAYPHEERRHRARLARSSALVSSFLPSFLSLRFPVAWVYLACNFLVDSREMPGKDALKDSFDPTSTEVVVSRLLRALLQCGRSVAIRETSADRR